MIIRNSEELHTLRECGRRLAHILYDVEKLVRPGVATMELDRRAEARIREEGGAPIFKGYKTKLDPRPYPGSLCVSVNDEVVHGIPSEKRVLRDGDIVGLDIGMRWPARASEDAYAPRGGSGKRRGVEVGLITDMAVTVGVGKISSEAEKLLRVTKESLERAIALLVPGIRLGYLGAEIQEHLEKSGYGVVRELAGHGVGRLLHEDPYVPNYGKRGHGAKLALNQVIAIEPMATAAHPDLELAKDGWTFKTHDGGLAAHFEHSVVILAGGAEVLTKIL